MSRSRLLILLLVLLCAAVGYAWWATPKQRRVTVGTTSRTAAPQTARIDVAPEVADLDFSGAGRNEYRNPQKNLFAPLYVSQPVRVKKVAKKVVKTKPTIVKARPEPKIVPVVQAPRPVAPPPLKPFKFLGHLKKDGQLTVFLSSDRGEIYLLKEGERFSDSLEVAKLTEEEVVIRDINTGQQVTQAVRAEMSQRMPRTSFQSGRPSFSVPKPVPSVNAAEKVEDK